MYQGELFDTELQYYNVIADTHAILHNLSPYTLYTVYIESITHLNTNQTEVLEAKTFQAGELVARLKNVEFTVNFIYHSSVPTESPQNITAISVDSTSILITVYPPSSDHQNGPIRNYTISYQQQSLSDTGEQQPIVIHVSSAETYPLVKPSQIRVYSLQPFTHYTFSIFATNDAGSSPSGTVTAMTDPAG